MHLQDPADSSRWERVLSVSYGDERPGRCPRCLDQQAVTMDIVALTGSGATTLGTLVACLDCDNPGDLDSFRWQCRRCGSWTSSDPTDIVAHLRESHAPPETHQTP